jgi:hypothetical protein
MREKCVKLLDIEIDEHLKGGGLKAHERQYDL